MHACLLSIYQAFLMPGKLAHKLLVAPIPLLPKPVVWQLSKRYIAGTSMQDAFQRTRELNDQGCRVTLDLLGEDCHDKREVEKTVNEYQQMLEGIAREKLDCNVSVKLSDLGLRFDQQFCYQSMHSIVETASQHDNFVRIDMEDSSVTDDTLNLYRKLCSDFSNTGTVIQAALRRSGNDVDALLDEQIARLRICKGIYVEKDSIAYTDADEIRHSYMALLEKVLDSDAQRIGIATHDPVLIEQAVELAEKLNADRARFEFQMLLGVAEEKRAELIASGYPLRVYVPYGERWHAYSIRRLRENPQIAAHIVKNLFCKG